MPAPVIKSLAIQAGISTKEAEKIWKKAKKEADAMGQSDNYAYITAIFKTMLGLDESTDLFKKVADKFCDSGQESFDKFIEGISSGAIVVSSDIPQELRPEQPPDEDEEEDEQKPLIITSIGRK